MKSNIIKGMVSAILPTYNRAPLLLRRLEELTNQGYKNIEIIVVDDASTDKTTEVIKSFNDSRIIHVTLHQNSGSVSIPRAIGISRSSGEFIAPIDDDVGISMRKFQLLVPEMKDDVVLAYGDRIDYWPETKKFIDWTPITDWNPLLPCGWGVDNGQFIYRSDVYDKIPIRFPKRACDWELAKQIKPLGKFAYIAQPISIYIHHKGNRSSDDSTKTTAIYPEYFKDYFYNQHRFKFEYNS